MPMNVLIVDDSSVMRTVIKRILKLTGIQIGEMYEAGNGKEGFLMVAKHEIDLILTDINMPVMDGVEFLKRVKSEESFKHIPVIIISTEGRTERIKNIIDIGASGYITKPFKPEDIQKVIFEALEVETDGSYIEEPEDSDF